MPADFLHLSHNLPSAFMGDRLGDPSAPLVWPLSPDIAFAQVRELRFAIDHEAMTPLYKALTALNPSAPKVRIEIKPAGLQIDLSTKALNCKVVVPYITGEKPKDTGAILFDTQALFSLALPRNVSIELPEKGLVPRHRPLRISDYGGDGKSIKRRRRNDPFIKRYAFWVRADRRIANIGYGRAGCKSFISYDVQRTEPIPEAYAPEIGPSTAINPRVLASVLDAVAPTAACDGSAVPGLNQIHVTGGCAFAVNRWTYTEINDEALGNIEALIPKSQAGKIAKLLRAMNDKTALLHTENSYIVISDGSITVSFNQTPSDLPRLPWRDRPSLCTFVCNREEIEHTLKPGLIVHRRDGAINESQVCLSLVRHRNWIVPMFVN